MEDANDGCPDLQDRLVACPLTLCVQRLKKHHVRTRISRTGDTRGVHETVWGLCRRKRHHSHHPTGYTRFAEALQSQKQVQEQAARAAWMSRYVTKQCARAPRVLRLSHAISQLKMANTMSKFTNVDQMKRRWAAYANPGACGSPDRLGRVLSCSCVRVEVYPARKECERPVEWR